MMESPNLTPREVETEIRRFWKFVPYKYKISEHLPAIQREQTKLTWTCKNCEFPLEGTFNDLENLWKTRKIYCPKCQADFNPEYNEQLPITMEEPDKDNQLALRTDFSAMLAIEENLGYQPYKFKAINAGKSIRVIHKSCNSEFSATLTMLKDAFVVEDKYLPGTTIKFPYCPKCNKIMLDEGVNWGGVRLVEALHNFFESKKVEFPYIFTEDAIWRYKDHTSPIVVKCKFCENEFTAEPRDLFNTDRTPCPVCHGTKLSSDSGERQVQKVNHKNTVAGLAGASYDQPIEGEDIHDDTNEIENSEVSSMTEHDNVDWDVDANVEVPSDDAQKQTPDEQDVYEPENPPVEEPLPQPAADGYPTDYEPTQVTPPEPDYLNPQVSDSPEAQEMLKEEQPKEESYEEMTESMHEIIDDLNIEPEVVETRDGEPVDSDENEDTVLNPKDDDLIDKYMASDDDYKGTISPEESLPGDVQLEQIPLPTMEDDAQKTPEQIEAVVDAIANDPLLPKEEEVAQQPIPESVVTEPVQSRTVAEGPVVETPTVEPESNPNNELPVVADIERVEESQVSAPAESADDIPADGYTATDETIQNQSQVDMMTEETTIEPDVGFIHEDFGALDGDLM